MFGNHRIFIGGKLLQDRQKTIVTAIADCHDNISTKSAYLSSFDKKAAKDLAKRLRSELRQPFQLRIHQLFSWGKFRHGAYRSRTVPGTDVLADVAPVN